MADHVHLAIQVAEVSLSRIIQNLSFRYTRWVNHRLGRQGHLFQGRYQALLIEADIYLLELVRYIHLYGTRGERLLGDDTFIREALEKAKKSTSPELSLDTVIAKVCEAYALREEDLRANGKKRRPAQARATVAWLVREHPRLTLAELSRRMNRDIATLSAAIERLLSRSEADLALARWLEVLKEELLRCSGDQRTCNFPQNPLISKQ